MSDNDRPLFVFAVGCLCLRNLVISTAKIRCAFGWNEQMKPIRSAWHIVQYQLNSICSSLEYHYEIFSRKTRILEVEKLNMIMAGTISMNSSSVNETTESGGIRLMVNVQLGLDSPEKVKK